MAFVSGTGILPFLDLVAYLYRKIFTDLQMPLVRGEGLRDYSKDIELFIFATFRRREEALGFDFCRKLTKLCKLANRNVFKFEARFVSEFGCKSSIKEPYAFFFFWTFRGWDTLLGTSH